MSSDHDDSDITQHSSMTPARVRVEQMVYCRQLYTNSIAPVLFANPLTFNDDVGGRLVNKIAILLPDDHKYSACMLKAIERHIERGNPHWTATVSDALTAEKKHSLHLVLQEK